MDYSPPNDFRPRDSFLRTVVAALVGLVGACAIWIAVPYNNYLIGNTFIADDYLPAAAMAIALLLVLVVNPLLRLMWWHVAMTQSQMALILGVMLMACVVPGHGVMRSFPYMVAHAPQFTNNQPVLAAEVEKMNLPSSLFPDPMGLGRPTPVADQFVGQLRAGESIPWAAWRGPLLSWGSLLAFSFAMMIGLGMIVLPQWRNNERLAFPLLSVEQTIIADPEPGHVLPAVFRSPAFWIAVGAVFLLHLMRGGQRLYPGAVPAIPLNWSLGELFAEDPWRHIPFHIRDARIYFVFVGVAFFMPNRISFSIWFFVLVYGVYRIVCNAYVPMDYDGTLISHRNGAMVALTLWVLWVGRSHWAAVFGSMVRRARDAADQRNRVAGWMFVLGAAGMFGWLVWAGVQVAWAAVFVIFGFMTTLLIARVVAETGLPFVRLMNDPLHFVRLAPASSLAGGLLSTTSMWFVTVIAILFPIGSRMNAAAMTTQALALDDDRTPRREIGTAVLFLGVLLAALLVSGAVHLDMNYRHATPLDASDTLINRFGLSQLDGVKDNVTSLAKGHVARSQHSELGHMGFGGAVAGLLYWACLAWPTWPVHPVGMLLVHTPYINVAWASILVGWLAKVLLVRFGGSRSYRVARMMFVGLIVGELLAAVFWTIIPMCQLATDRMPIYVDVLPRG